jgi:hypothetical protein
MEMSPVQKKLVWYTLSRSPQTRSTKLQIDHARLDMYNLVSTAGGGVLLPLLDNHSLEVLALVHLSLDVGDELGKVWCVILSLGPLLLGQELVGHGELESSAQTEDTVVGFLWSETLQGSLHDIVLLGEQVIGPQTELPVAGGVAVPVGQRLHPLLQPRPLHDVGGERRGRHGYGCSTADPSSRRRVLSSIAVLTVGAIKNLFAKGVRCIS